MAWFTDQVIGAADPAALTADGLYWHLEPNDYQDRPDYRASVSPGWTASWCTPIRAGR